MTKFDGLMDPRLDAIHQWLKTQHNFHDYQIEPASVDASFRRYFRLITSDQTRIIMDAPPEHEDCRPFLDVTRRLLEAQINAAEVLAHDLDQGFLLLRDLGSVMYLDQLSKETADPLYQTAMTTLIQMQTHASTEHLPVYDEALLMREMQLFPEWLIKKHLELPVPAGIQDIFQLLAENALTQPQVFVHRDYHSRNLTVLPENSPGVIDYQDAVLGPITYDLVSLLRDCYIRWPQRQVYQWLSNYADLAEAAGLLIPAQRTNLRRWFDLMGIQRHLKASGIFARLHHRDGKQGYLKDIPRTVQYIADVSESYPELKNLRNYLLTKIIPRLT